MAILRKTMFGMNLDSPTKHHERDTRDLASSTLFVFAFFAGVLAIGSMVTLVRSSSRESRAQEAIATWQSLPGRLTRLESFVRKSSFYHQVEISYRWQGEEKIFSESWIPKAWWKEGVGEVSIGSPIMLSVDPNDPGRAMWNPQLQAVRWEERVTNSKTYIWVGCISCVAFVLAGRMAAKRPNRITRSGLR